MRERPRATINELRLAIECLPHRTKIAMLEGIRANEIIVGAYSTQDGICPMLAAHRAGGRTDFITFAKAWDRFAFRGIRNKVARRATERELLILRTHLEASLLEAEGPAPDLRAAMTEHEQLIARRRNTAERARPTRPKDQQRRGEHGIDDHGAVHTRPGDPDRSRQLRSRPGWAWMRVVRRYDDYQRALERLESQQEARERELV